MPIEEQERLSQLVKAIKGDIKSFYKIVCALQEIIDNRLYREISDTFEFFCRDHLGLGRAYAYRTIAAAKVIKNLSPDGDIPLNEAQTRPLTKLEPKEQQLAWRYAIDTAKADGREISSEDVKKAVRTILGNDEPMVKNKTPKHCVNKLEQIELVSPQFKKAYGLFFESIKSAMNSKWETTSKEFIICRLEALLKFIKSGGVR